MTTGYQLERALKSKIPLSIRSKDNLAQYKEPSSGIINLQDSGRGNGSHWIAYFIPPPTKKIGKVQTDNENYVFDSFGGSIPEGLKAMLKSKGRDVTYSNVQLQQLDSDVCGEYCVLFLRYMRQGMNKRTTQMTKQKYLNFIYNIFNPRELEENDNKVRNLVRIR